MEFQIKFRFLKDKVQIYMYRDQDFEGTKELISEVPLDQFKVKEVLDDLKSN